MGYFASFLRICSHDHSVLLILVMSPGRSVEEKSVNVCLQISIVQM